MLDFQIRNPRTEAERSQAETREQALRAALRCGALDPQRVANAVGLHVTTVLAWADEPKYVGPSFDVQLVRWAEDVARGANPYAPAHTEPHASGQDQRAGVPPATSASDGE